MGPNEDALVQAQGGAANGPLRAMCILCLAQEMIQMKEETVVSPHVPSSLMTV
jgi:hypothetical protein